jgi:nucleoside phosphorylase
MANVDAALLTNDTMHHWDPGVLFMVGIAASANDEIALGDIVLGKEVYYYERGKVTGEGRRLEPIVYRADSTLWANVTAHTKWITPIPVERPDGTILRPRIHEGAIACGEKVIADKVMKDQLIAEHRKILAIEMESYGFSAAVWRSSQRRRHLVIRGISDRGDRNKNDDWQQYAAAASASFLKHCILDGSITARHYENAQSGNAQASSIREDGSHVNVSKAEMDLQIGDVGGELDATNVEMDSGTDSPSSVSQKAVTGNILPGSRVVLVNLKQSRIGPKKGKS